MRILRTLFDPGLGTRGMFREARAREQGERLARELLAPSFERALTSSHPTPCTAAALATFGPSRAETAGVLCAYAVRALARPDLGALAARVPRGRDLIGAAIDCLAGEGGWRE